MFEQKAPGEKITIGLFGTCGGVRWRDDFMQTYEKEGIRYFNPMVDDWDESMAVTEAWHLINDTIILCPILKETYGVGSLAEVGFGILNAIKVDDRRDFVVFIEQDLIEDLRGDKDRAKESLRARALVTEHLKKQELGTVYVVNSLEKMLEVSTQLYRAAEIRIPLQKYNPHLTKYNSDKS